MKLRLPSFIMASMLAFTVTASAEISIDSVKTDIKNNSITVSGTSSEEDANLIITVNSKDVNDNEFFDKLAYQNQIKTDSEGKFSDTFKVIGADVYTITVSTKEEEAKNDFVYADNTSASNAIDKLNSSLNKKETLEEEKYALGLFLEGVDGEPSYAELAGRISSILPLNSSNTDDSILQIQRQLIYQYIKEGKINNIFDYDKYLDIFSMPNNSVFTEDIFKNKHKNAASGRISGQSISNYDDFTDAITEAMILSLVKDPNGFGNVKAVLKAHDDFIGINTSKAADKVYKDLCGMDFDNIGALKKKFDSLNVNETESGGTGGGKTGGSKLSGGKVDYSTDTYTEAKPIAPIGFTDLAGFDWASESISKLASLGIVTGGGDGKFLPADSVTRSEFVKMVVLALNIEDGDKEITFTDIPNGSWAYGYVKAAYNAGIIKGISETAFGGDNNISRQDMAVIITRALTFKGRAPSSKSEIIFTDDSLISSYALDSVYGLKESGIMQGDENGAFNPLNNARRAEAAKVICSILQ